jgi:hypothetical protein
MKNHSHREKEISAAASSWPGVSKYKSLLLLKKMDFGSIQVPLYFPL